MCEIIIILLLMCVMCINDIINNENSNINNNV